MMPADVALLGCGCSVSEARQLISSASLDIEEWVRKWEKRKKQGNKCGDTLFRPAAAAAAVVWSIVGSWLECVTDT